jgi:hypothetical protein
VPLLCLVLQREFSSVRTNYRPVASDTTLSSALTLTTTDAAGSVVTTAPPLVTQTSVSVGANGQVYTVTQIVHNPTGGNDSNSAAAASNDGFFDNTGAVAGTFVVIGLAVTAGILAFVFLMLRRRRRQRLDRDVAAAAAAAAASHHHTRTPFDDDDEMAQYGGYYAATSAEQPPYAYDDPAGGYDHYAHDLPMVDRSSVATAAGVAGFGAQPGHLDQNAYAQNEPAYPDAAYHHTEKDEQPYYYDPNQAYEYVDDAYGGYDQAPVVHTSNVVNNDAAEDVYERGLKVTNV